MKFSKVQLAAATVATLGALLAAPAHAGKTVDAIKARGQVVCGVNTGLAGFAAADSAGKWPFFCDITADFIYLRLHGGEKLYAGRYPAATLEEWAARINRWGQGGNPRGVPRLTSVQSSRKAGRSVFVYFDNDDKACAPFDAIALSQRLGTADARSGTGPRPHAHRWSWQDRSALRRDSSPVQADHASPCLLTQSRSGEQARPPPPAPPWRPQSSPRQNGRSMPPARHPRRPSAPHPPCAAHCRRRPKR